MKSPPASSAESRVPLSRDRLLGTAIGLADAHGIESLTMRRLARELGVEAMTLYHYIANKDEILAGILEIVVLEMELPSANVDWKTALRDSAISAHQVLLRHSWAASLLLSGPRVSLARLRHMDAILGCLRNAGFSAEMTDHAYHALDSHITGFTLWQIGISAGLARLGALPAFLRDLDVGQYPHLAEHIEQHIRPRRPDEEGEFEFGLDLIIDGLERILGSR